MLLAHDAQRCAVYAGAPISDWTILLIDASVGARLLIASYAVLSLAGCGIIVPDIKESWDKDIPADPATDRIAFTGTAQIEYEIKRRIFCDLKEAVKEARAISYAKGPKGHEKAAPGGFLPPGWGAEMSISLEVDESAALNPGVSLITPLINSQSFALGLGGTLSSTATRIDKFDSFYTIKYLSSNLCTADTFASITPSKSSPFILESSLGIPEWLVGAMIANRGIPSQGESTRGNSGGLQPDTITLEIKFVIVSSGNITPTWKLVRVSANTGSAPFFGLGRTRTHDLIITIGPPKMGTSNTHLASQIGQAVAALIGRY